jgi:prevent-host-death family protein
MNAVTLAEAQQHLAELVHELPREGGLLITEHNQPVARLLPVTASPALVSLHHLQPVSVGAVLRPFPSPDDDRLDEMLDSAK